MILAQLLAANVAMRNVLVNGASYVGVAFAARLPAAAGEPSSS